jgi:hypothetical protein
MAEAGGLRSEDGKWKMEDGLQERLPAAISDHKITWRIR